MPETINVEVTIPGGSGNGSQLVDATSGDPALIADNDALTIQADIDFVSHGNLELVGYDSEPTWYDPTRAEWNDGGWFAFHYQTAAGDAGTDGLYMIVGYGDNDGVYFGPFARHTAANQRQAGFNHEVSTDDYAIDLGGYLTGTVDDDGSAWSVSMGFYNPTGTMQFKGDDSGGNRLELGPAYLQVQNISDAAAPSDNRARIYVRDNSGKDELVCRFATGAIQRLAIQP